MYQSEHFVLSPKGARSRQLEEILASENQVMLVAEDDGKVIGFAHVMLQKAKAVSCLKPQTNIYLQDLVVRMHRSNQINFKQNSHKRK